LAQRPGLLMNPTRPSAAYLAVIERAFLKRYGRV
jgi:hypothetical protein